MERQWTFKKIGWIASLSAIAWNFWIHPGPSNDSVAGTWAHSLLKAGTHSSRPGLLHSVFSPSSSEPPAGEPVAVESPVPQTEEAQQEPIQLTPIQSLPATREAALKEIAVAEQAHRETIQELSPGFEKLPASQRRPFLEGLLAVSRDRSAQGAFLASLPGELRPATEAYVKAVFQLQDQYLAMDGINREYLRPHLVVPSAKLEDHAQLVRSTEVSAAAQLHIKNIQATETIRDEDIQELIRVCDKQKRCIEKGALAWMEANHAFNSTQFASIAKAVN